MLKNAPAVPTVEAHLASAANELNAANAVYQRKKREMEAKLAPLKAAVDALEESLLTKMLELGQESIGTKQTTVSIRRTTFVELYDDKAFFEYVGKKKAWDLVRKQPVLSACRERWDDKKDIPGTRPGTKMELSVTSKRKPA